MVGRRDLAGRVRRAARQRPLFHSPWIGFLSRGAGEDQVPARLLGQGDLVRPARAADQLGVRMGRRQDVIETVARTVSALPTTRVFRVAVDGVDGAGKTFFADELARAVRSAGRRVIRASVDGFHNPRAVRYLKGRSSPVGFFEDSYDYATLEAVLLGPLGPGGSRHYRVAAFDHQADRVVETPVEVAAPRDILIFDGIFLDRPELRAHWDYSVFL